MILRAVEFYGVWLAAIAGSWAVVAGVAYVLWSVL